MKIDRDTLINIKKSCDIRPGQRWKHYKGDIYEVHSIAFDCNTNEIVIVYYNQKDYQREVLFTRTISEWHEVVDNKQRFELCNNYNIYLTHSEYVRIREEVTGA